MAGEFRGEDFECVGENTEKYISFSVPSKKEHDNDSSETITYKIKFIDSLDSCQVNYEILLITCLKLIIRIARHAQREKILNQNGNLLGLKITD